MEAAIPTEVMKSSQVIRWCFVQIGTVEKKEGKKGKGDFSCSVLGAWTAMRDSPLSFVGLFLIALWLLVLVGWLVCAGVQGQSFVRI